MSIYSCKECGYRGSDKEHLCDSPTFAPGTRRKLDRRSPYQPFPRTDLDNRYVVLKRVDIEKFFCIDNQVIIGLLEQRMNSKRIENGKKVVDCLVIESDWPEYEIVKAILLKRINEEDL